MQDVLGQAIYDYYFAHSTARLWIHSTYGEKELMPVKIYFRKPADMPELELIALQHCTGKVLDIGAGAGSHALLLQQQNIDVTALDISEKAVTVMRHRGVKKALAQDIFTYREEQFDTLLLLMNGIGLSGTTKGLRAFLQQAKTLLRKGGQLLFDSSDVAYLYDGNIPETGNYYGEIQYRYEFKKQTTDWFTWLYIDKKLLAQIAAEEGWNTTLLYEDEYDQFLVQLTLQ